MIFYKFEFLSPYVKIITKYKLRLTEKIIMNLFAFFSSLSRPKTDDLFNNYPDGIFIVSMDGRILDVNLKIVELFGFSRFDMVGQYFSQYIQGGSGLLNKIVAQKSPSVTKAQTAKEEDVFVEVSASKDLENDRVIVTLRNVTQSYKMQNMVNGEYEIAKKIIDEKNTFLTEISPEIVSSLDSVTGFSKALLEGIGGHLVDKQEKYVSIINKNSKDLSFDLERMFEFFKLESGLYKYDYRTFDLPDLLNGVAKTFEPLFESKKTVFKYDFSALATRGAYLDPVVIEEVIKSVLDISYRCSNLGTVTFNAGNPPIEFLEANGYDVTDENIKKQFAMFEIKDTSFVLTAEQLENVFNPYFIDNSQSKNPIGIKMTYPIIKKHLKYLKGDVWVYSKAGAGTMVCILVPVEKQAPAV